MKTKRRCGGKTDYDMAVYGYCVVAGIAGFCFPAGLWFVIRAVRAVVAWL